MSKYKTIGILGGMGPEATAELYKKIISLYQREKGAIDDADFPNIIINSIPAEDMLNDLDNRRQAITSQIQEGIKVLEQAGTAFVAIPCNTASTFLKGISGINVPIVEITEETAKYTRNQGYKTVGMLASSSTIKTKIYENILNDFSISMIRPNASQQKQVNKIIMRILAGQKNEKDWLLLSELAVEMRALGAEAVILGCTELPLLIGESKDVCFIDTIEVLARAIFKNAALDSKNEDNQRGIQ